ncbi:MAG: hypothetical protein GY765_06795 [bacterium]|nr:hypothetical protein [bacterium]
MSKILDGCYWDYPEGAVTLRYKYGVKNLLGFKHCDYIDWLWHILIDMPDEYCSKGESESGFPDMPLRIGLKTAGPAKLIFTLGEKQWKCHKDSFVSALPAGGENFFNTMRHYRPESDIFLSGQKKVVDLKNRIELP